MPDLSFPEILDATPAAAPVPATLHSHVLAPLTAVERGIAELRAEHGSLNYDVATAHGYKLATARRHAVRLVRYEVPKIIKAKRAELKDIGEALTFEGDRIIAMLRAIEDPHDALIEAEDQRRAAAKAEREAQEAAVKAEAARVEALRVDGHRAAIATIRSYLDHSRGLPADRILAGIDALNAVPVDGMDEFGEEALRAKGDTLEAMRTLHTQAIAAEQEAARIEAQRIEQARVAAEQAERQRALDEQAAEIARQSAELARAQAEQAAALKRERDAQAAAAAAVARAAKAAEDEALAAALRAAVVADELARAQAPAGDWADEQPAPPVAAVATETVADGADRDAAHRQAAMASIAAILAELALSDLCRALDLIRAEFTAPAERA